MSTTIELRESLDETIHTHQATGSVLDALPEEQNDPVASWTVLAAASAIIFVGVGYTNTFGVFQEYYQKNLFPHEPAENLIMIGSVASSLYFTLGVVTGPFADLVGYRTSLILGTALMVGAMFAASVSKEYYQLFLSQGLMFGLGVAFVYPPATTISRQYFGPSKHGMANGIVVSGGALGGCVLPYAVSKLISRCGLPSTFRTLGYVALGILVPSIALIRTKPIATNPRRKLLDLSLLTNPHFLGLILACTIAMTGFLARYFLIPTSATAKGLGPTYASWLLGLMNGLSILGRIGIGLVADRFGKVQALSASFIICGLCHILFWLPAVTISEESRGTTTAFFTVFVVFIGIFGSGFISLFPVVVAHLFGKDSLASKTGLLNTAVGISTLAGPSAIYAIIGDGTQKRWTVGVLTAGLFMFVGGSVLVATSVAISKSDRTREDPRDD